MSCSLFALSPFPLFAFYSKEGGFEMGKIRFLLLIGMAAAWALMAGCAATPKGMAEGKAVAPKVELERVEVASYFPYDPKIRVPLVLAFLFKLENPNDVKIGLESIKFTVGFEAEGKKGEFFNLATPIVNDSQYVPAKTVNELRVVTVIDSQVVPGNLAVTSGSRLAALGIKAPDLIKYWYEKIGDFPFAVRVSEGSASFTSERGDVIVGFEGMFPMK
jgi:hypothetical protein